MCVVKIAFQMKEEGNQYYKQGDFKRALAKYTRVQCYTNAVLPSKDGQVQMFSNLSNKTKAMTADEEEVQAV